MTAWLVANHQYQHLVATSAVQVQAPHNLSPNVSLREFKIWRSAWADHEELLQLQEQPPRTQLAHFRSCLTPEMRGTLTHAVGISKSDDSVPLKKVLDHLTVHDDDAFDRGLLELRNTPRPDGRSPAQVLFGRRLRTAVPAHRRAFTPEW